MLLWTTVGGVVLGCETPFPPIPKGPFGKSFTPRSTFPSLVTRLPKAHRIIAIGDLHGDLEKARWALKVARVMNDKNEWIGEETIIVQVGDLLDRGSGELKIIYLLEKLKRQAQRAGGDVQIMTGNHEVLNMEGDFRYVTQEGFDEFENWSKWYAIGAALKSQCKGASQSKGLISSNSIDFRAKGRISALMPGGPIVARFLAFHPVVLTVGSTMFAHAGVQRHDVKYGLEKINKDTRLWMLGNNKFLAPWYLKDARSVIWNRTFPVLEANSEYETVDALFAKIPGIDRMVIGHTIMKYGIQLACDRKIVCIDVGMSKGCTDALPQVLEILDDRALSIFTTSVIKRISVSKVYSELYEDTQENRNLGLEVDSKPETLPSFQCNKEGNQPIPLESPNTQTHSTNKKSLDSFPLQFGSLKDSDFIASTPEISNAALTSKSETLSNSRLTHNHLGEDHFRPSIATEIHPAPLLTKKNLNTSKSEVATHTSSIHFISEKGPTDRNIDDITTSMQKLHISNDEDEEVTTDCSVDMTIRDIMSVPTSVHSTTDISFDTPQPMDIDEVGPNEDFLIPIHEKKRYFRAFPTQHDDSTESTHRFWK